MLAYDEIIRIVSEVAKASLKSAGVSDVICEPAVDSAGREALRITIVIKPGAAARLKGDAVLDTLVQIQDRLLDAGDERFPIIEYATKEELEAVDDPES